MTSTTNTSILLADSLAQFSKAAYGIYTEIETQSRLEVLRAVSETREAKEEAREAKEETREAKSECDKIARDLHVATLEAQAWKQATAEAKAALAQAELTIAHQLETQHQTIADLRREVTQWKDQSQNWQEHFLRVEQERCGQSSRIDELLRQQHSHPINVFTAKQKYTSDTNPHTINSAPASIATKEVILASPTQPPSYKSAAPHSPSDAGSSSETSPLPAKSKQTNPGTNPKRRKDVPFPSSSKEVPQSSIVAQHPYPDSSKRKAKATKSINATASSSQQLDPQTPSLPRTTLIRRVQAVIQVKQEESDDASGEDVNVDSNQRRSSRRRRKIISDDDIEQHYLAADGNPVLEPKPLRRRNVVNYQEDNEDDDDDDELMMGAEENHEEVYGTQRIDTLGTQRSKQQQPTKVAAAPPKKKRRLGAR